MRAHRHPLPVFGGNARPVLEALAEIAATTEAARFMEGDSPLLATGYIEEQMSRIALADVVTVPEDPPG